jgi:hypothetical protein
MGRWFGYRDDYADVCRIFMTPAANSWYAHIADATEELRRDFKSMERAKLTPKEFGLRVRSHPTSLIVTARNKMRAAHVLVRQISLSGQGIETARLRTNPAVLTANARLADNFLAGVEADGSPLEQSQWDNAIWRNVSKGLVASFLREFQAHPLAYQFQGDKLADFLERTTEPRLQEWDVVVPKGSHEPSEPIGPVSVRPSLRRVAIKKEIGSVLISGSRARVGSRGVEREGLTLEEYQRAMQSKDERNVSDGDFRRVRSKPLLLIHLLKGYVREGMDRETDQFYLEDGPRLVAVGLSFPLFDDSAIAGRVEYVVNAVEWRSIIEAEADDDIAGDDDDD